MNKEQQAQLQAALVKRLTPSGKDYAIFDINVEAVKALIYQLQPAEVYGLYTSFDRVAEIVDQYKKQLSAIEVAIKEYFTTSLEANKMQSLSFSDGKKVYRTTKESMKIVDDDLFYRFILNNALNTESQGVPLADGFLGMQRSVNVNGLVEALHDRVMVSLEDDPYLPGSPEDKLSSEEQIKLRTKEVAELIGVNSSTFNTVAIKKA